VGGGMPTALSGPDGFKPKSLEVSGSDLYFTGIDPMSGSAGAFKVPTAGGMVSVVASGMSDPSGITVDSKGTAYIVDTIGSGNQAQVIAATSGEARSSSTVSASDIRPASPSRRTNRQSSFRVSIRTREPTSSTASRSAR